MIIWGGGRKSKNPDDSAVPFWCSNESELRLFGVFENYRYGHVYGIRVAKWNVFRWLECQDCGFKVAIPNKDGFAAAVAISGTWKVLRENSPTGQQLWQLIAKVTECVLGQYELAEVARSNALNEHEA